MSADELVERMRAHATRGMEADLIRAAARIESLTAENQETRERAAYWEVLATGREDNIRAAEAEVESLTAERAAWEAQRTFVVAERDRLRAALEAILALPRTYPANDLHLGPCDYPTPVDKAQDIARRALENDAQAH